MAFNKDKPDGTDLISDIDLYVKANNAVVCKRSFFWSIGYPVVATTQGIQFTTPTAGTITKAWARVTTAPTGAALLFDININGVSIWTTQGNRLTIAASATTGNQTTFDISSFAIGDVITLDIDQIGSTVAGSGLTIQLDFELA